MSFFELLIPFILFFFFTEPVKEPSFSWTEGEYVRLQRHPVVIIDAGRKELLPLSFRVKPGYHIMSNTVENENFLTSELTLAGTGEIQFGPAQFPPPVEKSLQGSEEAVLVFSDSFLVEVPVVVTATASKGVHSVNGVLFYQACDDAKCYFPRELTFQATVKIK